MEVLVEELGSGILAGKFHVVAKVISEKWVSHKAVLDILNPLWEKYGPMQITQLVDNLFETSSDIKKNMDHMVVDEP